MKKVTTILCSVVLVVSMFTGCGLTDSKNGGNNFDKGSDISVISREEGSGTRGAFVELFGIEEENAKGEKIDAIISEAGITNNTSVMMSTVAGDEYAIGYVSLGSLNDTVKSVKIDGAEASADNINAGTYSISRPFNIVNTSNLSNEAKDFVEFIMSSEGQKIVEDNGYISVGASQSYASKNLQGKITVAGSSSVSPVMEKLKEAYIKLNSNMKIEIQTNDSSTGISSAVDGTCDIGMASRNLKDSETSKGLLSTAIAMDGIAVIVNNSNTTTDLTSDEVKQIFMGKITTWDTLGSEK